MSETSWENDDPGTQARRFLEAVDRDEPRVRAWVHLDRDNVRDQAGHLAASARRTPLWGLPIGVKDTIDVAGLPAERGSRAFAGRRPTEDAAVIRRLRDAGALICGKTVTTELAVTYPGPTTNPHDVTRTPGGSSSGSAAAVAAGMVPVALGTQTIASTLRPASFCGVVGFKPSHGRVPLDGILAMSPEVDSIGILGNDVAVVSKVFATIADDVRSESPVPDRPVAALLHTPWWECAEAASQRAVDETAASLIDCGVEVWPISLDGALEAVIPAHWDVVRAGIANRMGETARRTPELLSEDLLQIVAAGRGVSEDDLAQALQLLHATATTVAATLAGCDIVVSPCAVGEAPTGLGWTGDPLFCQPWSALGFPAMSLPLAAGENGLPIGVQFGALPGRDEELLTFAETWLRRDPRMVAR